MSQQKSDPPSKPQSSSSPSQTPVTSRVTRLEDRLRASSEPSKTRGRRVFGQHVLLEAPDLLDTSADLQKATETFASSADTIIEAEMLILGRMDDIFTRLDNLLGIVESNIRSLIRLTRLMCYGILILLGVLVVLGGLTYRSFNLHDQLERDRDEVGQLYRELSRIHTELVAVRQGVKSTDLKVEAVRHAAEDQPSIKIVPDLVGSGAKVVISQPPTKTGKDYPILEVPVQLPLKPKK